MKSIITTCLTLLTLTSALPLLTSRLSARQTDLESETDRLLFSVSMDDFQTARDAQEPPELDWYSNGCTASPDEPLGYDFQPSCQRHDFGYHNFRNQERFTEENKDRIDSNFKKDLYNECDEHGTIGRAICRGVADVYYEAVSAFGGQGDLDG